MMKGQQMLNNEVNSSIGCLSPFFDKDRLKGLCKTLSVLSKFEAMNIFIQAKDGFVAEASTHSSIGLSKKQYYTRLKQLVDCDLLAKRDGSYFHTTMGTFVYEKHLLSLLECTKKVKHMRMLDVLKSSKTFSEEEISNITHLIHNLP